MIRRWWLRHFVYGASLYDFAVLSVRAAEAEEQRQTCVTSPVSGVTP